MVKSKKLLYITALKETRLEECQIYILQAVSFHAYKLDTPPRIHLVFHVSLLRPASSDPFPSQQDDDNQPSPIRINNTDEYEIEEILCARSKKWGRGFKR